MFIVRLWEPRDTQNKRGKNQYVSGIMGISYSPFWNAETGVAYKIFKTAEVLNFCTDKLIEIDVLEEKSPNWGWASSSIIKGGSKRREKRPGQEHWRVVENAPAIVLPLP